MPPVLVAALTTKITAWSDGIITVIFREWFSVRRFFVSNPFAVRRFRRYISRSERTEEHRQNNSPRRDDQPNITQSDVIVRIMTCSGIIELHHCRRRNRQNKHHYGSYFCVYPLDRLFPAIHISILFPAVMTSLSHVLLLSAHMILLRLYALMPLSTAACMLIS